MPITDHDTGYSDRRGWIWQLKRTEYEQIQRKEFFLQNMVNVSTVHLVIISRDGTKRISDESAGPTVSTSMQALPNESTPNQFGTYVNISVTTSKYEATQRSLNVTVSVAERAFPHRLYTYSTTPTVNIPAAAASSATTTPLTTVFTTSPLTTTTTSAASPPPPSPPTTCAAAVATITTSTIATTTFTTTTTSTASSSSATSTVQDTTSLSLGHDEKGFSRKKTKPPKASVKDEHPIPISRLSQPLVSFKDIHTRKVSFFTLNYGRYLGYRKLRISEGQVVAIEWQPYVFWVLMENGDLYRYNLVRQRKTRTFNEGPYRMMKLYQRIFFIANHNKIIKTSSVINKIEEFVTANKPRHLSIGKEEKCVYWTEQMDGKLSLYKAGILKESFEKIQLCENLKETLFVMFIDLKASYTYACSPFPCVMSLNETGMIRAFSDIKDSCYAITTDNRRMFILTEKRGILVTDRKGKLLYRIGIPYQPSDMNKVTLEIWSKSKPSSRQHYLRNSPSSKRRAKDNSRKSHRSGSRSRKSELSGNRSRRPSILKSRFQGLSGSSKKQNKRPLRQPSNSKPMVFVFDIGNEKVYYYKSPLSKPKTIFRPMGDAQLSDIAYSEIDENLKWITPEYVDSCTLTRSCARGKRTVLHKAPLVQAKYDSKEKAYFYLTRTHLDHYDASTHLRKTLAAIKHPVLMELGYNKRQVYWTQYDQHTTVFKWISYDGGKQVTFHAEKGHVYGFGIDFPVRSLYICGFRTIQFEISTRTSRNLAPGYECSDMESDGNGLYTLSRSGLLKYLLPGRKVNQWDHPKVRRGALQVVTNMRKHWMPN